VNRGRQILIINYSRERSFKPELQSRVTRYDVVRRTRTSYIN